MDATQKQTLQTLINALREETRHASVSPARLAAIHQLLLDQIDGLQQIDSDKFIRKDRPDRTPFTLASDIGFDVADFLADTSGARLGLDMDTGHTFLEIDRLYVRLKAYFRSLTIIEREALAGEQQITPGGGVKCTSVRALHTDGYLAPDSSHNPSHGYITAWRCYFLAKQDGEQKDTKIVPGDQVISQTFNATTGTSHDISNTYWWRLVTAVSNNAYTDPSGNVYGYIEVSAADCASDSDIPAPQDNIVQLGNRSDSTRQSAILLSSVSSDSPSMKLYTRIGSGDTAAQRYSLSGHDIISYGYDPTRQLAYLRCYGDVYIGAPDGSTYIKYDAQQKKLRVKAEIEAQSTISGNDLDQYIKDLIPEQDDSIANAAAGAAADALKAADDALKAADDAQTLADEAQSLADEAHSRLTEWAADGVISPLEKQAIKDELARIKGEKADFAAQYTKYGQSTPQTYLDVWNSYAGHLTALSADQPENIPIPATFATSQTAYYTQRTALCSHLATLARQYAEQVAQEAAEAAAQAAVDPYRYLKESLQNAIADTTHIQGGLILSTMIALGYTEGETRHILSGMNGSYVPELAGRTPAAWYGGNMVDRFSPSGPPLATVPSDAATSLIRMDGSSYWAKGNIRFNSDGSADFGAWGSGLHISPQGAITLGSGIYINLNGGDTGLKESLESIITYQTSLDALFTGLLQPLDSQGNLLTLTEALQPDPSKPGTCRAKTLRALANLLSTGEICAYTGSSGTAGVAPLDEQSLAQYLTDHSYIQASQLSAYATQQWVEGKGYATTSALGSYYTKTETDNHFVKALYGDECSAFLNMNEMWSNKTAIGSVSASSNAPGANSAWYNVIQIAHRNGVSDGPSYVGQIALGMTTSLNNMFFRTHRTSAWQTVVTTSNISSYAITSHQSLANYVDKTSVQTISARKEFTDEQKFQIGGTWTDYLPNVTCGIKSNAKIVAHMFGRNGISSSWIQGRNNAVLRQYTISGYSPLLSVKTTSGSWEMGAYDNPSWTNNLVFTFCTDANYNANNNAVSNQIAFEPAGTIWASSFHRNGGTASQFLKADGSVDSTAYLPLTGGTLTGTLNLATGYGMSDASGNGLLVYKPVSWTGVTDAQWGVGAVNIQGVIRSSNSSLLHYRNNVGNATIWDSGNDGSGSGLDADLLDGCHLASILRESIRSPQNLDADSLTVRWVCYTVDSDMNTWGGYNFTNFATTRPEGGFSLMCLKEGKYAKQIQTRYNDNHLYIRSLRYSGGTSVWNSWSTLALTTDNVASATKLANARTIWGQNFDGTGNVNGHLSIGTILGQQTAGRAELSLISEGDYPNDLMLGRSGIKKWSITSRNSAESDYFGIYNYPNGSFRFCILENGNVGIGTSSPARTLDVAGIVRVQNWLYTVGNAGWYSETHGGGWYMTDSTWIRTYNSKSIYAGSGTIRTDGRLEVGGNGSAFLATSAGNVTASGEITAYSSSDIRLKQDIAPLRSATEIIARLRPVTFRWNTLARELNPLKDTRINYGLIAQHVQTVMPELVHTIYGSYSSLDYGQLITVLIAASQEQQDTITRLTNRVRQLEDKLGINAA